MTMEQTAATGRGGRLITRGVQIAIDLAVMLTAYLLAWILRLDFRLEAVFQVGGTSLFSLLASQLLALLYFDCYKLIWRYISIGDLPPPGLRRASLHQFRVLPAGAAAVHARAGHPSSIIVLNAGLFFLRPMRRAPRPSGLGGPNATTAWC